jgi:8-oxo-dGTP diphosphatase
MNTFAARPAPPVNVPRIGVGVLVVREARVLLGQRLGAHGAGHWAAPGGHLEFGESIEACARREVLEEAGLPIDSLRIGPVTNDVFQAEGRHYLTVLVLATAGEGEPRVMEPHKCAGWRWFRWDDLPQPLFAPLAALRDQGYVLPADLAPVPEPDPLLALLRGLESELHHPGSACPAGRLAQLLHPDFHEVGRSGRRYDRATVLRYLSEHPGPDAAEAGGHRVERLAEDCALLSFWTTHPAGHGELRTRVLRSSVWRRSADGWQLFYHQGTPAAPD